MIRQVTRWTEYRWGLAFGGLLARWCAWVWLGVIALGGDKCGLVYVDWELVLALATGVATVGVLMLEHKRGNRLDDYALDYSERLAALEAKVEAIGDRDVADRLLTVENSIAGETPIGQRVAALEAQPELSETVTDIRVELAEVKARIDFKPVTHTRRKDGKFAPASDAVTCEAPKP